MLPNSNITYRKKSNIKNSEVNIINKKKVLKQEDKTLEQILHPKSYKAVSLNDRLIHHESTAKSQKELRDKNRTDDLVKRLNSTKKGRY